MAMIHPAHTRAQAKPGHAGVGVDIQSVTTPSRVCTTPSARPVRLTVQPRSTPRPGSRRRSAARATTESAPKIHAGAAAWPPGLPTSRRASAWLGSTGLAVVKPASLSSTAGFATTTGSHGSNSTGGTANATAILAPVPGRRSGGTTRETAATASAPAYPIGTKAVSTASSRPDVHAALHDPGPGRPAPTIRAAARTSTGRTMSATHVPSRPEATAPMTAGRSAYVTVAQTRRARDLASVRMSR